jgi:hypothetical protein
VSWLSKEVVSYFFKEVDPTVAIRRAIFFNKLVMAIQRAIVCSKS